MMHRVLWIGLLLLACASSCSQVDTTLQETPSSTSKVSGLKIVSWNMNWLNHEDSAGLNPRASEDYEALSRYASQLDADIIVVQEVDGQEAVQRVFDPKIYAYHMSSRGDIQRVGIIYKKSLNVVRYPDLVLLARVSSERLRYGVDLGVKDASGRELRILGVHLKSGCFSSPLDGPYKEYERPDACQKLKKQVPVLTRWMESRQQERTPFMLIGDMNRRLNPEDEVWQSWKNAVGQAGLYAPTLTEHSRCWGGKYPQFIDHMILDRRALNWMRGRRFFQLMYSPEDEQRHGYKLSDHCPVGLH